MVWEHYLVYAVALGVAKQVMKQLMVVYPQVQDHTYLAGSAWFHMAMTNPAQFDNLTSSMQSFRTAFTPLFGFRRWGRLLRRRWGRRRRWRRRAR